MNNIAVAVSKPFNLSPIRIQLAQTAALRGATKFEPQSFNAPFMHAEKLTPESPRFNATTLRRSQWERSPWNTVWDGTEGPGT